MPDAPQLRPSEFHLMQELAATNILVAKASTAGETVAFTPGKIPWVRVLVFNALFAMFALGLQFLFQQMPEQKVSLEWFMVAVWGIMIFVMLLFTGIIVWMYRKAHRLGPWAVFDATDQTLKLPRLDREYSVDAIRGLQIIHAKPRPQAGQKALPRTEMNVLVVEDGQEKRRALLASSLGRGCYDDLIAAVQSLGFVPIVRVNQNASGSKSTVTWAKP